MEFNKVIICLFNGLPKVFSVAIWFIAYSTLFRIEILIKLGYFRVITGFIAFVIA